jgi:hypothetical protein
MKRDTWNNFYKDIIDNKCFTYSYNNWIITIYEIDSTIQPYQWRLDLRNSRKRMNISMTLDSKDQAFEQAEKVLEKMEKR